MQESLAKENQTQFDTQPQKEPERRSHPWTESVFARIEDTTYAILRKHGKKPA
jgi:hypothetical protein